MSFNKRILVYEKLLLLLEQSHINAECMVLIQNAKLFNRTPGLDNCLSFLLFVVMNYIKEL